MNAYQLQCAINCDPKMKKNISVVDLQPMKYLTSYMVVKMV